MSRRVSAVVIVFMVIVALVWRCTGDEKATAAPYATPPVDRDEPGSASAGIAEPDLLPAARVEIAPEERPEPPRATAGTSPTSASSALVTLRGRLDDAVPRPIQDGHVWVNLGRGETGDATQVEHDFEAPVREDGTFEFVDLPPGRGQIVVLCRGWVSRRTPFDPVEAVTLRLGRQPTMGEIEQAFQEEGPETLEAQRITVPFRAPLVVAMERTGTLQAIVMTPKGSPLAGARVTATSNVHWIGSSSATFPWRTWESTTDPWGRARIDDLPPEDALSVVASHEETEGGVRRRWEFVVKIRSGQTSEIEIVGKD